MHAASLALAQRWEHDLGDPESPRSPINFSSALALDEREEFPSDHLAALTALGCFEALIPATEGGALAEPEQLVLLGRLIARRDPTTAIAFGQTMLGSLPVWLAGNTAQKQRLAADLRGGRLGCLALTEKDHGSDILANTFSARLQDDRFVFTGEKWLINNGRMGGSATVMGKLQRPGRAPEAALWWLRKTGAPAAGWREHPKIPTHGIRGADISGFDLDGYTAGRDTQLQGDEPALYTLLKTLQVSRILCSGFSLGALDTLFRLTLRFAHERHLYGKGVIEIPVVRARLAGCFTRILAADALAQVCGRAIAALPAQLSLWSAVAKFQVPTEAEAVARELAVVLGARHYVRSEAPWGLFQKLMRDNQVVSLFDGSTQVNLSLIASQLRALGEGLRRPTDVDAGVIDALLRPAAGCAGWPAQAELQLSNQGCDAIVQTFLHTPAWPAFENTTLQAVEGLQAAWRSWLADAEQVTKVLRLPQDAVRTMALAQRYAGLHAAALLVLVCDRQATAGIDGPCSQSLLLTFLSAHGLAGGLHLPDSVHDEVMDQASSMVAQRRLLSLQTFTLAG